MGFSFISMNSRLGSGCRALLLSVKFGTPYFLLQFFYNLIYYNLLYDPEKQNSVFALEINLLKYNRNKL